MLTVFLPFFISINLKSLTYSINHLKWVKIKKFLNNSYALNMPYRGPLFQKRINHMHLIRKKRRTFFPKKNKPYIWLIRHWRVVPLIPHPTLSQQRAVKPGYLKTMLLNVTALFLFFRIKMKVTKPLTTILTVSPTALIITLRLSALSLNSCVCDAGEWPPCLWRWANLEKGWGFWR